MRPDRENSMRRKILFMVPLFLAVFFTALLCVLESGSMLVAVLHHVPTMMPLFCIGLFCSSIRGRVGKTRHCARCDYQQAPTGDNPDRCPECGAHWLRPDGAVMGRLILRPGMAFGAIGLGLTYAVFLWMSFAMPNWQGSVVPASSLIKQVTTPRAGFDRDYWVELAKRTLSPQQEARLAEGLLDRRLNENHACRFLSVGAEAWFVGKLRAGTLPPELVERYYEEMLDVSLAAPDRAVVGESVSVGVSAVSRSNLHASLTGADESFVYFEGFYFGPDPSAPVGGGVQVPYILLDERGPSVAIEPARPGRLSVRAVLWEVVGPAAVLIRQPIWNENGTPVIQPGVTWHRRVELERVIEVADR